MNDDDRYIVLDEEGKLMPWGEFTTHDDAYAAMCEHVENATPINIGLYWIGKKSEYDKHNPQDVT